MTDPFAVHLAADLDRTDPLRSFRDLFLIPPAADIARAASPTATPTAGQAVYLVGNSLGLQPRATRDAINQELDDWARLGVEAHFHAKHPWFPYHEEVRASLARCVGALPREVVAMNSLTANLHLLMVSFYRPTRERFKIVIEDAAFPSDSYAVQSQADFHARHAGFDPRAAVVRLSPRPGESTLRTEDIVRAIDEDHRAIALVMLGGVNYLTGQLFDIDAITTFARERGITVGWDLAHAAGNIDLRLHDWGPDFAAWCSYKYLNAGPGAIAGAFVHERHLDSSSTLPRFAGWWGNDPTTRFRMAPDFIPAPSADAWALSNPSIFATAPLRVSLELFDRATMPALREKSRRLTAYLESLIDAANAPALAAGRPAPIASLTPRDPLARGCQLSLVVRPGKGHASPRDVHRALLARGIVTDFREPDVIRAAPVPLYNTFADCRAFALALRDLVATS